MVGNLSIDNNHFVHLLMEWPMMFLHDGAMHSAVRIAGPYEQR